MEINEYQMQADKSAVYPKNTDEGLYYVTMGLVGEAGEVANKIKKVIRDGVLNKKDVADELGDVLWYVAMMAYELGFDLNTVAENNLQKLRSRLDRGVVQGEGDSR
jgi:NTP pyrophosphatase (non-canonical NTP hydrolase)